MLRTIASYLSIAVQLANIFPLIYMILTMIKKEIPTKINGLVYFLICLGVIISILLANFWKGKTVIGGKERSTALIVLTFFAGGKDPTIIIHIIIFKKS